MEAIASPRTVTPAPARFDMYAFIHKGLRHHMNDTLHRVGAMDVDDAVERERVLGQVDSLLGELRHHLQHENDFVHTAIEARRPGGARLTAEDHIEHLDAIEQLEEESRTLRGAPAAQRPALATRLYRHLAVFVAENLEHMNVEEVENNTALWALYSDAELVALHDRLVASLSPASLMSSARLMAAALNPQELAGVFGDMQRKAPPEAFRALLDAARPALDAARWEKLALALNLPRHPLSA